MMKKYFAVAAVALLVCIAMASAQERDRSAQTVVEFPLTADDGSAGRQP